MEISDLVLTLLAYVSEQERAFIKQRQKEGIALAKKKGVKFGRKETPYPEGFDQVYIQYQMRSMTGKGCAESLGITYHQFMWYCRKRKTTGIQVECMLNDTV